MIDKRYFIYDQTGDKDLPIYVESIVDMKVGADAEGRGVSRTEVVVYCEEGQIYMGAGESLFLLKSGFAAFGHAKTSFIYQTQDQEARLKVIGFDGVGARMLCNYIGLDPGSTYQIDSTYFNSELQRIIRHAQMQDYFNVSEAFQHLLYDISCSETISDTHKNIAVLKHYIQKNYCQGLDNQMLADLYGTSVSYLCREFKQQYQTSPMAYVTDLRISKACRLLADSNKKVAEVALECGYANAEYFCYTFKKHENCTPLQYRKRTSQRKYHQQQSRTGLNAAT